MKKVKVGIVGGSGYTGIELLRLLAQHPHAEVVTITGRKDAGTHVAKMFPSLRGRVDLVFEDPASAPLDQCDVVFFCDAARRSDEHGRKAHFQGRQSY